MDRIHYPKPVYIEIGLNQPVASQELTDLLGLDKGYLSKIIKKFGTDGVIKRTGPPKITRAFFVSSCRHKAQNY